VAAPPDFAPAVQGVVTLYDRILQAAIEGGLATLPPEPSFTFDILPLILRSRGLRWVHDDAAWSSATTELAKLSDKSQEPTVKTRRANAAKTVRRVESVFTHPDYTFKLCQWQRDVLVKYEAGTFASDFGTATQPDPTSPTVLTRSVLDGTVGEGFFPGIEAGIIVTRTSLYSAPFEFRLDHGMVSAGDLTALMAQPWQADFKKCSTGWWPTQRPNKIPPVGPSRKDWDRQLTDHQDWVDRVMQLGVITRKPDQAGKEVQEETDRDEALGG
jgi:hypothetical protein